jgi:hypothetical protein
MKNKFLTGIVVVLTFILGLMVFASNRSISQLMEAGGEFISDVIGRL